MTNDPTGQALPTGDSPPTPADAPAVHEVDVGLHAEPGKPPEPTPKAEAAPPTEDRAPEPAQPKAPPEPAPEKVGKKVLTIDIGGTNVKILATGYDEPRKFPSGKTLTPRKMVEEVIKAANGWEFDVVSLGYPGVVGQNGPRGEPGNLAEGWIGFDFADALGKPVKIINDAAMQALGCYEG